MIESITLVETRIKQVEERLADFKKQESARKAEMKIEDPSVVGKTPHNIPHRTKLEDQRRDCKGNITQGTSQNTKN